MNVVATLAELNRAIENLDVTRGADVDAVDAVVRHWTALSDWVAQVTVQRAPTPDPRSVRPSGGAPSHESSATPIWLTDGRRRGPRRDDATRPRELPNPTIETIQCELNAHPTWTGEPTTARVARAVERRDLVWNGLYPRGRGR